MILLRSKEMEFTLSTTEVERRTRRSKDRIKGWGREWKCEADQKILKSKLVNERKQRDFEFKPELNWDPVELLDNWSDVMVGWRRLW